jgi:hypothetical protein
MTLTQFVSSAFGLTISILLLAAQDRLIQPIVPRKQVALVIGNAAYSNRPLSNSANDAQSVAGRLKDLNYDVTMVLNGTRKQMAQAIDSFVGKLGTSPSTAEAPSTQSEGDDGIQVEGQN